MSVQCAVMSRSRLRRLRVLGAATLLAGASLSLSAGAASAATVPAFPLPPTTLSAPGTTSEQDPASVIAANRRGDAVVVWKLFNHGPARDWDFTSEVQVAFRKGTDAPGVWSAPQRLTAPGWRATADWFGRPPLVGIDDAGIATISWSEIPLGAGAPDRKRQRVVTHGPSGFGLVQEIISDTETVGGSIADAPVAMAVTPDGQAQIAYPAPGSGKIVVQRRATPTGAFAEREPMPGEMTSGTSVALAMHANGAAAVAWETGVSIQVARAAPGQAYGTATEVGRAPQWSPGYPGATRPAIAIDGTGAVTVAWVELGAMAGLEPYPNGRGPFQVSARRIDPQGAPGPTQRLAAITGADSQARDLVNVRLGVDDSGQVTAAWASNRGRERTEPQLSPIHVATAPPGSSFGAAVTLAERAGGRAEPVVAVDPTGTTVVAWGGTATPATVAWRSAGSDVFQPLLTPTSGWVGSVAASFGRPNELSLALAADFAPRFVVQTTTSVLHTTVDSVPAPAPDTIKPVLSVKGVTAVKAPRKKGKKQPARLVATLAASEAATVRIVVSQTRKGMRRGGTCVKRPVDPKKRKGRKSCTRTVVVGPEVGAPVGPQDTSVDLGTVPPKGSYMLTVKGRDAAGNVADAVARPFTLR